MSSIAKENTKASASASIGFDVSWTSNSATRSVADMAALAGDDPDFLALGGTVGAPDPGHLVVCQPCAKVRIASTSNN